MKDWRVENLDEFLSFADNIDSEAKFFFISKDKVEARITHRYYIYSYVGLHDPKDTDILEKKFRLHGFIKARLLETKEW